MKFPKGDGLAKQGKHWFILAETAHGTDPVTEWNKVKPAFLQNGWTLVKEDRGGGLLEMLHYAKSGVETWASVDTDGSPLIFRLDVIEVTPLPFTVTLAAPAATPEKIATEKGDFPYLAPLPGSKFHNGGADTTTPFRVQPRGADRAEIVANGTLFRNYDFPEISNVLLTTAYRDALTKGGWVIVREASSVIRAHYAQRGRKSWAMVLPNGPRRVHPQRGRRGVGGPGGKPGEGVPRRALRRVVRFQQVDLAAGFRRGGATGGEYDGGG